MAVDITLSGVGGEYMESAVLVEWKVADGTHVASGEVVAVVETAKAATEVAASADGVLRILVPQGEEITVGSVLGRLGEEAAIPAGAADAAAPFPDHARGLPRRWPPAYASPLAKRLATERGIDLRAVRGSGPGGRIVRADLTMPEAAATRNSAADFTIGLEVDATALLTARADRWEASERPSIGDLVATAAGDTLRGLGPDWSVLLGNELPDVIRRGTLAVVDLSPFGITTFTPPHPARGAVLGICAPRSKPAASAGIAGVPAILQLTLSANADDFSCGAAGRFLAALRGTLEAGFTA